MVQFPGFTIYWPTFGFPWHTTFFRTVTITVYHSGSYKPQSRTIMGSRESLPSTVNLFGGQSGRLKAFQAFQATIGFSVGSLLFWILDPESIPSISRNHWIHCLAPFIFGSWILEGFRLWTFVIFKSSVWTVWMLDIGHDRFHLVESSRGNILLTKGTHSHVCKGSVYNLQGY